MKGWNPKFHEGTLERQSNSLIEQGLFLCAPESTLFIDGQQLTNLVCQRIAFSNRNRHENSHRSEEETYYF